MILKNGLILNKYYLNSTLNKYNFNLSSGGGGSTQEYVLIRVYMKAYECVFRGEGGPKIAFFCVRT